MTPAAAPTPQAPLRTESRRRLRRPPLERRRNHPREPEGERGAPPAFADSLRLCLRLADEASPHFPAAALQCYSKLLDSCPELGGTEGQVALAALASLRRAGRYGAAETLREICVREEQQTAARILDAWIAGPPSAARSGAATSAHALISLELEELG